MTRSAPAAMASASVGSGASPKREVSSSAPLPEILQNRQPMFTRQHDQLGRRRGVDKPEGPEIARVDLQIGAGLFIRRGRIVAGVGPVRGADLDQTRPGLAHHVRDAESTANLNGFSARDHDLLTGRHRRQHQKHRRGAVVHDQRRFCAGQHAQQPGDLAHAAAALVALRLDLQRDRVGGRLAHRLGRLGAHRRPTEIGVDDDAGGIEHRSQPRPLQRTDGLDDAPLDLGSVECLAAEQRLAHLLELGRATRVSASSVSALPSRLASATIAETGGIARNRSPLRSEMLSPRRAPAVASPLDGGIRVRHRRRIRNKNGSGAGPLPVRSGREDLNLRPQRPERCALTGLRYSPHRSKIP